MVELLAESFNPHVRYGAAIALGIACAGTGLPEAIELLEPMTRDNSNFVRQGALIALSMILIQHNETMSPKVVQLRSIGSLTSPKVPKIRGLYERVIKEKTLDHLSKFGAILAQGIIDAGGRNVTISLQSAQGHANMTAILGITLGLQYWYWFPFTHFLSLAFTPTAVIALNKDLKVST